MLLESSQATAAASPSANLVAVVNVDKTVPLARSNLATPPLFAVTETWNIPAHIAIPIGYPFGIPLVPVSHAVQVPAPSRCIISPSSPCHP